MVGPILIVVALVIAIPVGVIVSGGVLAAIISFFVQKDVDGAHPGSELIDLNG